MATKETMPHIDIKFYLDNLKQLEGQNMFHKPREITYPHLLQPHPPATAPASYPHSLNTTQLSLQN